MSLNIIKSLTRVSDLLSVDRGAGLNAVAEVAASALDARRVFVLLYQPESEKLSPVASSGLTVADFRKLDARSDAALFRGVYERSEPLILEQVPHGSSAESLKAVQ